MLENCRRFFDSGCQILTKSERSSFYNELVGNEEGICTMNYT